MMDNMKFNLDELIPTLEVSEDDTYIDEADGGLRHCKKCGKRRETRLVGLRYPVPCTCDCAKEKEEREKTERRIRELREMCFSPSEQKRRGYTFAAADDDPPIRIARRYVEHWEEANADGYGLLFYGVAGAGKSYTVACILNELIEKYQATARFLSAAEIVSNLLSRQVDREEYLAKLCRYQILVIDDVGAESNYDRDKAALCDAIDARDETGKATIFTTNFSLAELEKPPTPILARIIDRMRHRAALVRVVGQSHRRAESDRLFGKWSGLLKPED